MLQAACGSVAVAIDAYTLSLVALEQGKLMFTVAAVKWQGTIFELMHCRVEDGELTSTIQKTCQYYYFVVSP